MCNDISDNNGDLSMYSYFEDGMLIFDDAGQADIRPDNMRRDIHICASFKGCTRGAVRKKVFGRQGNSRP